MKPVITGRSVKVTRKVTRASVQAPSSLPRNWRCQSSRQPAIRSLLQVHGWPRTLARFRGLRLFFARLGTAHAEVLQLAGEGVAPPPEQPRSLLPMALRALEGRADEHAFELWLRGIQQRGLTRERVPLSPALQRRGPVRLRGRLRGHGGELRRQVGEVPFAPRGQPRQPPAQVTEPPTVAGPNVGGKGGRRAGGGSSCDTR